LYFTKAFHLFELSISPISESTSLKVQNTNLKMIMKMETQTHKRNVSDTSALSTSPSMAPATKRQATFKATADAAGQNLASLSFPAVVFLLQTTDGEVSSTLGVFAGRHDANAECRRLGEEHGLTFEHLEAAGSSSLERWEIAEGVSCWVEVMRVAPKTYVRSSVSPAASSPRGDKLYDNEESDDEIVEEGEEDGNYD
jgi:hypothetical protein